jgi:hypothetical protein
MRDTLKDQIAVNDHSGFRNMPDQVDVEYKKSRWQIVTAILMIPSGLGLTISTGALGYGTWMMTTPLWDALIFGGLAISALGGSWLTAIIVLWIVDNYTRLKPRFSLRTLMILTAVVAVGLGICMRLASLSREYQKQADEYALEFQQLFKELQAYRTQRIQTTSAARQLTGSVEAPEERPEVAENIKRIVERLKVLRPRVRKYQDAARYPWLPVGHDE